MQSFAKETELLDGLEWLKTQKNNTTILRPGEHREYLEFLKTNAKRGRAVVTNNVYDNAALFIDVKDFDWNVIIGKRRDGRYSVTIQEPK